MTAGFFAGLDEIPRVGLQYLDTRRRARGSTWPGASTSRRRRSASHAWFRTRPSAPADAGAWFIGNQSPYSVNGYMLEIPARWADQSRRRPLSRHRPLPRRRLVGHGTGAVRLPAVDGRLRHPAPAGTHLDETVLLLYEKLRRTPRPSSAAYGYQHPDEWEGGA